MVGPDAKTPMLIEGCRIAHDLVDRSEAVVFENGIDEKGIGVRKHANINTFGRQSEDLIFQQWLDLNRVETAFAKKELLA